MLELDMLFFAMCLLTPFMFMLSIALHFLWRFLTHKTIKEEYIDTGNVSVSNARREEMPNDSDKE